MSAQDFRERLAQARQSGVRLEQVSESERPDSLESAYAIAASLTAGRPLAGFKVGATSARARQILGLSQPFYGRIEEESLHRSPATLRLGGRVLALEAEIGLELASALPARSAPYSRAAAAAAVRRVMPLIEINAPSFTRPLEMGGLCLIADNGVNAGAVLSVQGSVRLDAIRNTQATLAVGGKIVCRGVAAEPPDDPLSMLCWLANCLSAHGIGLEAGQVVATGTLTAPLEIAEECMVEGDFGALGAVQITLVR